MGAVGELVAPFDVTLTGVVLHEAANRGPLWVPHGQPGAELGRERQQVQLVGQLAMVSLGRLLQAVEVGLEGLGVGPGRPVDPLEHRVLLVAPPVGAGHLHQLEVAEPSGRRDVGADTHVDEGVGVAVEADDVGVGATAGLACELIIGVAAGDPLDDGPLVGVVGHEIDGLGRRDLAADERLVRFDDLPHLGLDALQILVVEGLVVAVGIGGQLEVVVEAVLDRWADRKGGAGPQLQHRLGQDVGRRVP